MDGTSINHRHFHPHLASHTTSAVELQTKVREDFTSTYHLAQCLNSDVNALVGSFPSRGHLRDCEIFANHRLKLYCWVLHGPGSVLVLVITAWWRSVLAAQLLYRSAVMVVKYLYQTYSSYTAGLCARNNKFIYHTIKYIRILSCITSWAE